LGKRFRPQNIYLTKGGRPFSINKWFIRLKRTWKGDLTEYGFLFSVAGRVKSPENAAFLPEATNREEEPVLVAADTMYASVGWT